MKKKRPQQQVTPPTKGLNILALKRSASQVEPSQEQPAEVSIEKPEIDAASAPEPLAHNPVDEPDHASRSVSASSPKSTPEPVPDPVASSPVEGALFQAVGLILGEITTDGDKTFVIIGEKSYALYYASTHKRAYEALKKEITCTGITQQKLIVYPRITHFPGGKQPYRLEFQLAGFVGNSVSGGGIESVLEDLEFKICGLWQFIPVCRVPCISVFKPTFRTLKCHSPICSILSVFVKKLANH